VQGHDEPFLLGEAQSDEHQIGPRRDDLLFDPGELLGIVIEAERRRAGSCDDQSRCPLGT